MPSTTAPFVVPSTSSLRLARSFEYGHRRRAFRALDGTGRALVAAVFILVPVAALVGGYRLCKGAGWLLDPLKTHLPVVALAFALIARSSVARLRQRGDHQFATSWLSVAPIDPREVTAMVRERVFVQVTLVLVAAVVFVGTAGWINAIATGSIIVALLAGGIPGALAGWWSGRRPAPANTGESMRIGRPRGARGMATSLAALGRWPFAERFSALRPRVEARVFGAALLSMPMGIPPLVAILLLVLLILIVIATTLLKAQLTMLPRAADWLRATPLALSDFAVSSCARVFLWQCVYTFAAALVLAALGAGPRAIAATTVGWVACVALSMVTALACRHRPDRMRIELAVLFAVLAAGAAIAWPVALPVLAAAAIVQWKRAVIA